MKGLNDPVGKKGTVGGVWMIDVVGMVEGYEGSAGWSGRGARCLCGYGVGEDKRKKKPQCRKTWVGHGFALYVKERRSWAPFGGEWGLR